MNCFLEAPVKTWVSLWMPLHLGESALLSPAFKLSDDWKIKGRDICWLETVAVEILIYMLEAMGISNSTLLIHSVTSLKFIFRIVYIVSVSREIFKMVCHQHWVFHTVTWFEPNDDTWARNGPVCTCIFIKRCMFLSVFYLFILMPFFIATKCAYQVL